MRKLVTLLLAAGLVLSATTGATAAEVKVSGRMDFSFDMGNNMDFQSTKDYFYNTDGEAQKHNKHFAAQQRLRMGLQFIASENLSAYYEMQVGTFTWGGPAVANGGSIEQNGGGLGSRAANITTRYAYLDWMVPNTDVKVRMGQQPVAMPSYTFGSPVLDDSATGIMISAPVNENITVTGGWLRAVSSPRRGNWATQGPDKVWDDNFDLFNLTVDFKYDGFQVSPWILLGPKGKDATTGYDGNNFTGVRNMHDGLCPLTDIKWESVNGAYAPDFEGKTSNSFVWFAGIGGELTMFDPFRFTADFYYSQNKTKHRYSSRAGWVAMLGAEYNTEYGTPALKAWYGSGDDKNPTNGSERALSLSGAFNPNTTYFDGVWMGGVANTIDRTDASGTWGVGLYWNNLSFMENLSHNFGVSYFAGTNAKENISQLGGIYFGATPLNYMTKGDSAIEFDFTSVYNIYQNLAAALELSYIVQNFDDKTWGRGLFLEDANGNDMNAKFSNIFSARVNLRYTF